MFFLFEARLEKPLEMSRTDFYDLWRKDAGSDRLMVVFDMASRDRIDALMQELPIWTLDAQHLARDVKWTPLRDCARSEEHTSELQSLMRNSYAVFCLQQKKTTLTSTKPNSKHHNNISQQ